MVYLVERPDADVCEDYQVVCVAKSEEHAKELARKESRDFAKDDNLEVTKIHHGDYGYVPLVVHMNA